MIAKYIHFFVFGIYPYIAMGIFLLGSLFRFEREQYSWKSESTQLIYTGSLRLGNNLFHIGILGIFGGHLVGLLTPVAVWDFLGVSHTVKQVFAMSAGGIMGTVCLSGILILIYRRITSERLRALMPWRDKLILGWILITLSLGLSTIYVSSHNLDGHEMVLLMTWAQHIVTFRTDAASVIWEVSIVFKIHMFLGMSLFIILPFTRLVHIWSGFASIFYLGRSWQLVRPRNASKYRKKEYAKK